MADVSTWSKNQKNERNDGGRREGCRGKGRRKGTKWQRKRTNEKERSEGKKKKCNGRKE